MDRRAKPGNDGQSRCFRQGVKHPIAFSSEVDAGSREESASNQEPIAFSSEVDTGSREENASNQEPIAFSSEVDTGSREENASNQEPEVFHCFHETVKTPGLMLRFTDVLKRTLRSLVSDDGAFCYAAIPHETGHGWPPGTRFRVLAGLFLARMVPREFS
jgi:hypothetical protein